MRHLTLVTSTIFELDDRTCSFRHEPLRPIIDEMILRIVLNEAPHVGDLTITTEGFRRLNPEFARKVVIVTSSVRTGVNTNLQLDN